jgi:hypothetical protein
LSENQNPITESSGIVGIVMRRPTIKDVPTRYRLRQVGEYNAGVTRCCKCDTWLSAAVDEKNTLLGFAQYDNGLMQIHECRNCFKKQRFHVRELDWLETLVRWLDRYHEKVGA